MIDLLTHPQHIMKFLGLAFLLLLTLAPMTQSAPQRSVESEPTAPAYDPPHIVVTAGIDRDNNLLLVNFRTIYIGFTGESYNSRSVSKAPLKEVQIFTVDGEKVSLEIAREQLDGKDTPILCSSYNTKLPDFYVPLFSPQTLHFIFPEESPEWTKIQEPGRPLR